MKYHFIIVCFVLLAATGASAQQNTGSEDRAIWVEQLTKIADPVLSNLAKGTLKKEMPYISKSPDRKKFSYLEAAGRTICGIAPWLELGPDNTPEGMLRKRYIDMTVKAIGNAVNPGSPDYLTFGEPSQPLVDAAFLAQGLLRAPQQLWGNLSKKTKEQVVTELKRSRQIKPGESNWLLFASMVEAALQEFTGTCDTTRLYYGIRKFRYQWYKGDANYGDGEQLHVDYYNSFVIHPMLTDVLTVIRKHKLAEGDFLELQQKRLSRYAEQQERMISPEGAFPVVGRSIVYRTGVFHALGTAALMHLLPKNITPAQVRCALTRVIMRQFESPANFDAAGWLNVGFNGSQLQMSESYINTGSTYLCLSGFLPLGLPASDPFWANPYAEWTSLKAWTGKDVEADHAL